MGGGNSPFTAMKEKLIEINDIVWCRSNKTKIDPLRFTDYGIEIRCVEDFVLGPRATAVIPTGDIVMKSKDPYVMIFDTPMWYVALTHRFRTMGSNRTHNLEIEVHNMQTEPNLIPAETVVAYAVILNNVTTKFFEISPKIMERSF